MIALLFDVETTGLIENHTLALDQLPEIIEFYGCLANLETGQKLNELELLIHPSKPLSEEIKGITHLTDADLEGHLPFSGHCFEIETMIVHAPLVIAHNLSFDKEMIDVEYERLGTKIAWPAMLCSVEQTIHLKGKRLSLTALHEHLFEVKFKDAHRAKQDVDALLRCCVELHKRGVL